MTQIYKDLYFKGAHNTGNDEIVNLQLLVHFVLDSLVDRDDDYYDNPDSYINDAIRTNKHRIDQRI